jgi:hypothetical protein
MNVYTQHPNVFLIACLVFIAGVNQRTANVPCQRNELAKIAIR